MDWAYTRLLVELHLEGSAPAARAAGLFIKKYKKINKKPQYTAFKRDSMPFSYILQKQNKFYTNIFHTFRTYFHFWMSSSTLFNFCVPTTLLFQLLLMLAEGVKYKHMLLGNMLFKTEKNCKYIFYLQTYI